MGEAAVRIGPGQEHEDVGSGAERAPRLGPVDDVAGFAVRALGWRRRDLDAGHVGAVVGLGHGHRGHDLSVASFGSHLLLLLGPAAHEARVRISGRVMRAADAERPRRSSSVATTMPRYSLSPPSTSRRTRPAHRPKAPIGQAGDDALGNVTVGAVDVFGDGRDLLVGEGPETVLHQLEVRIEVARARRRGQFGLEVRTPVAGEEVACPASGASSSNPHGLAPDETAPEVVQRLGDEGAREAGLDVALRRTRASSAPSPPPPRRGPGRRRATGGPPAHRPRPAGARPPDDELREIDGGLGRLQVRGVMGADVAPSGSHLVTSGPTAVGRCVASGAAALPGVRAGQGSRPCCDCACSAGPTREGARVRGHGGGSVARWPAGASASCAVAATSGSWARSPTPCSTPEARSPASS